MFDDVLNIAKGRLFDIIPDKAVKRCKVCGREYLPTRNDAEDVWLVDMDGNLICGRCDLERRQ